MPGPAHWSSPPATLRVCTPGVSSEAREWWSRAEASVRDARKSEPPKEPGLQQAPKLAPPRPPWPWALGVSPWARAPGSEQPGTKAGAPFVGRGLVLPSPALRPKRGEVGALPPAPLSADGPTATQRGAGRCFLRPFPRQPWAGSCSPHRCKCSLAAPAALATSSCQTAASRAASGPGPVSSPSARVLLPARGPADTLGAGRQETVAACPPREPPSPATAGGAGRGR